MTNPDSSSRDTPHSHTVYTYILDTHQKRSSAPGWRRHNDTYPPTYHAKEKPSGFSWTIQGCEAGNGNSAAAAAVVVAVDTVKRPSGSIIRLYV